MKPPARTNKPVLSCQFKQEKNMDMFISEPKHKHLFIQDCHRVQNVTYQADISMDMNGTVSASYFTDFYMN